MEIKNCTRRPLAVPLPGGKKLRLGPGGVGQIAPKAADFAPLKAMIEKEEIEIVGEGKSQGTTDGSGGGISGSLRGSGNRGGVRHTGDR